MSLVAKVEQLVAEMGDGLLHAVKHVAAEVEKLQVGTVDEEKVAELLSAKLSEKLTSELEDLNNIVGGRVLELEKAVAGLQALVHSPASPPEGNDLGVANAGAAQPVAAPAPTVVVASTDPSAAPGGVSQVENANAAVPVPGEGQAPQQAS